MATIIASTAGGNWTATTAWIGGIVPTASSIAILGSQSGPITVNALTNNCLSFDCTGYANTLNFASNLTVNGANATQSYLIFSAGMTVSGTGTLNLDFLINCTFSGKTIPCNINLGAGGTKTINDYVTCNQLQVSNGTNTLNGGTLSVTNGINNSTSVNGTSPIVVFGGSIASANVISNNLFLQGGNITLQSFFYSAGTLKYVSGTVSSTGTLTLSTAPTIDIYPVVLNNVSQNNNTTATVSSTMSINGTFSINVTTGVNQFNGANILLYGNLTTPALTTGIVSGTSDLFMLGNGTMNFGTQSTTGRFAMTTDVRGTYSLVSSFMPYSAQTLRISGNVSGLTLSLLNSKPTIQIDAPTTFNMIQTTVGATFSGNYGFVTYGFSCSTTGNITLKALNSYLVTGSLFMQGTLASPITLQTDVPGTMSIFTLQNGAYEDVGYVNATDIDSSNGRTIWGWKAVLVNTLNWNTLTSNGNTRVYASV